MNHVNKHKHITTVNVAAMDLLAAGPPASKLQNRTATVVPVVCCCFCTATNAAPEPRWRSPTPDLDQKALSRARMSAATVAFTGAVIPTFAASTGTAPLIASISERRLAMRSCSNDGRAPLTVSPNFLT